MHPGSYIFTEVVNNSGWSNSGLAFMMGLLSVQWTMTDYDAGRVSVLSLHTKVNHFFLAAHISEEVHRAAIAAPVAIFVAVLNTGVSFTECYIPKLAADFNNVGHRMDP